jgi:hypothetical protein
MKNVLLERIGMKKVLWIDHGPRSIIAMPWLPYRCNHSNDLLLQLLFYNNDSS